ncbi:MAG: IS6 family transposase [Leptolyngbyaceae cyanobacterium MO_188.B28]|nr:IS6 family transposase [Leptolyngbyaceae cyanobacterium MO_188.B28]
MDCPHCHSTRTTPLKRITNLGYAVFCCKNCRRTFNGRTGTPFNFLEFPTDIVFQVLLCRLRYKLSYRDVAEFFLVRGFEFTHETVRDWEERFAPIFADELRAKRKGKVGKVWHVDETYIRVRGRWCYLYRAIDQDGNLVDVRLSETRDMAAAIAFFRQTQDIADVPPEQVFTDGLNSYPRAIKEELGAEVKHEVISCLGNPIEQSHRGIKQRYYPTLGFGTFESAKRFCQVYDEVHQFFRPRQRMAEFVSLADRREHFLRQVDALHEIFEAA